jgi:hypothetical protein
LRSATGELVRGGQSWLGCCISGAEHYLPYFPLHKTNFFFLKSLFLSTLPRNTGRSFLQNSLLLTLPIAGPLLSFITSHVAGNLLVRCVFRKWVVKIGGG